MAIKFYNPTSAGRRAGSVIDYKAVLTKFEPELMGIALDAARYFAALLGLRGAARTARIKEVLELVEMTGHSPELVAERLMG